MCSLRVWVGMHSKKQRDTGHWSSKTHEHSECRRGQLASCTLAVQLKTSEGSLFGVASGLHLCPPSLLLMMAYLSLIWNKCRDHELEGLLRSAPCPRLRSVREAILAQDVSKAKAAHAARGGCVRLLVLSKKCGNDPYKPSSWWFPSRGALGTCPDSLLSTSKKLGSSTGSYGLDVMGCVSPSCLRAQVQQPIYKLYTKYNIHINLHVNTHVTTYKYKYIYIYMCT